LQAKELSPRELVSRWPDHSSSLQLLDVREPAEIAVARVAGAVCIPMREIPARLGEIMGDRPVVVICHKGSRSRQVAAYLLANGYGEVFNLAGGIDAWSCEIDSSIPRY
jgi:rhodanese-related sulfurtransferase